MPPLSKLWRALRRKAGGSESSYLRGKLLAEIEGWTWPFWSERPNRVPVHVLTSGKDWRLAAWMLASWFHMTEQGWHVVIHDDGTLPADARRVFEKLFASARIVPRGEADAAVRRVLHAFPFCADYRALSSRALKVFDAVHFAKGNRLIVLDSDVLFFKKPREILGWTAAENGECWFNEGSTEEALVSASEAREEFGIRLWQRVNTGICLLEKSAIDFDFCDRALAETSLLRGQVHRIEPTLFSLCASRHGRGGLLPKSYEVSLDRAAADTAISRHYAGAMRERFFADGLSRVRDPLFAEGH